MSVASSFGIKRTENWDVYHLFVFLVNVLFCLSLTPTNVATHLPDGPASAGLLVRLLWQYYKRFRSDPASFYLSLHHEFLCYFPTRASSPARSCSPRAASEMLALLEQVEQHTAVTTAARLNVLIKAQNNETKPSLTERLRGQKDTFSFPGDGELQKKNPRDGQYVIGLSSRLMAATFDRPAPVEQDILVSSGWRRHSGCFE